MACWSLESDICWGGWSTYVSTALSSHKDDNLMSLQLKKTLKIMQRGKNETTTYTVLMFRCLEFGCVGGAVGRKRRFGSSSEVTQLSCFHRLHRIPPAVQECRITAASCVQVTRQMKTFSAFMFFRLPADPSEVILYFML